MFYSRSSSDSNRYGQEGVFSLNSLQTKTYYQIYEDGHPLNGMAYDNIRVARRRLRSLIKDLTLVSAGWYVVSRRLPNVPVRNTLGVRKTYNDGSTVHVTYTIRQVIVGVVSASS